MTVDPRMQEVNVRVAVRVRPILPKEKVTGASSCVRVIQENNQVVVGSDRAFTFNNVLLPDCTQEDVYQTCVEPLVKSIFDGYNSTVFAYGQTGSGKTYTIGGANITSITEEEYGIIPRAVKQMYDIMAQTKDMQFKVKVSYVEIYMEELRDLLNLETSHRDMHVREDEKGNTVIIGAHEEECESLDEVMSLLDAGSAARTTGATQMNEHSSRSHAIFTMVIGQDLKLAVDNRRHRESSDICEEKQSRSRDYKSGKFHFVDLAGSERAHRTGNVGDRFKESVHINSGLLALGNVISALGDPKKKMSHIPYRQSKITRLLKDSLGGNAKTLMICCISPDSASFEETLNSLKYSNRAKNIKNKPIVNRDEQYIRVEAMQTELLALRERLARQNTNESTSEGYNMEKAQEDANLISSLKDKVARLESEGAHYRMIAEEAYKQFIVLQEKDQLSRSQEMRVKEWLDLMEEIRNKVTSSLNKEEWENKKIQGLERELSECKAFLKNDEAIFAEKYSEITKLKEEIAELVRTVEEKDAALQESEERRKEQEQQMIVQQMRSEQLEKDGKSRLLSVGSSSESELAVTASAPPATGRRPKSVPVQLKRGETGSARLRLPPRDIKSSPALFSLDRVMQRFRARSQILVNHLEDCDDVIHQTFSDDSPVHSDNEGEDGTGEDDQLQEDGETTSNFSRRGTYKLKKAPFLPSLDEKNKENHSSENVNRNVKIVVTSSQQMSRSHSDVDRLALRRVSAEKLRGSTDIQRKQLKQAQLQVLDANQKIRDLAINIRMKEQLIRELVKTGQEAELMNKQYVRKIREIEKEKENAKMELNETNRALQDLEGKEVQEESEKKKLQMQYKQKIEAAKLKMNSITKKQRETEKVANFASQNKKKIQELEVHVERMKQQQDSMQRKLKEETERKTKLERDMQKEQQRVKELELKNEQQQKMLKRKNAEIAAAQRKLRGSSLPPIHGEEYDKLEEQKMWLDTEIEKVIQQRQQMENLNEELRKREEIVAKKEAMLAEKSELEIKKLRSSQMITKDLLTVSTKLDSVEKRIAEKSKELSVTPEERQQQVREEIQKLRQGRDKLTRQRSGLDEKLHEGSILSAQEERRLIELDEAIETLDAAIEFKTEAINTRKLELRKSQVLTQNEDNLINRLNSLSNTETKALLSKYFEKVINLKEAEHKRSLETSEMECKLDEQERLIRELESVLQRSAMEMDRRLTQQQRDYEVKIQLLVQQLNQGGGPRDSVDEGRVQQLEKELYYYKKTSRDLRRKVKDLIASGVIPNPDDLDLQGSVQSVSGGDGPALSSRKGGHSHGDSSSSLNLRQVRPPSAKHGDHVSHPATPLSAGRDVLSHSATQVKVPRRDLRLMSSEEISMRRSNRQSGGSITPRDSLENGTP
ncbi:kinesin-like protein KIF27 [Liolophura sinensis]|uniref:kinesin-like protein KIF27 n=1 Tax=Liolophura sinensis TaxID=3198878 RepID=UPI00315918E0